MHRFSVRVWTEFWQKFQMDQIWIIGLWKNYFRSTTVWLVRNFEKWDHYTNRILGEGEPRRPIVDTQYWLGATKNSGDWTWETQGTEIQWYDWGDDEPTNNFGEVGFKNIKIMTYSFVFRTAWPTFCTKISSGSRISNGMTGTVTRQRILFAKEWLTKLIRIAP